MLIYLCQWSLDKELAKGLGKPKAKEFIYGFTVICRSSADAVRCLQWYHESVFFDQCNRKYTINDGIISLARTKIDSRGFTANYLLMDGMKEPLILSDVLRSNILRLNKIFRT